MQTFCYGAIYVFIKTWSYYPIVVNAFITVF